MAYMYMHILLNAYEGLLERCLMVTFLAAAAVPVFIPAGPNGKEAGR